MLSVPRTEADLEFGGIGCWSKSCSQFFFLFLFLNFWEQSLLKMKIYFWETLYTTKNMIKPGSAERDAFYFSVSASPEQKTFHICSVMTVNGS